MADPSEPPAESEAAEAPVETVAAPVTTIPRDFDEVVWDHRVERGIGSGDCPTVSPAVVAPGSYGGPLFDSHFHPPHLPDTPPGYEGGERDLPGFAVSRYHDWTFEPEPTDPIRLQKPIAGRNVTMQDLACLLAADGTDGAFSFFPVFENIQEPALEVAARTVAAHPDLFVPFIMPPGHHDVPPTVDGTVLAEMVGSRPGLFVGYGEIGLYGLGERRAEDDYPPDAEILQGVYRVADEHRLMVYLHPGNGQADGLARALEAHPDIEFIVHGDQIQPFILDLMDRFPNVSFTVNDLVGDQYLLRPEVTREEFFRRTDDFATLLRLDLSVWKPMIEAYPDRFMWGTDRGGQAVWTFDLDVGRRLVAYGRAFIAGLDPSVRERFAYRNAHRIMGSGLDEPVASALTGPPGDTTGVNALHDLLRDERSTIRFGTQADPATVTLGPTDGGRPTLPPYDGKNSLNVKMPVGTPVLAPLDLEFVGFKNRSAVYRQDSPDRPRQEPFDDLELCFESVDEGWPGLVVCAYHLRTTPLLPGHLVNEGCRMEERWTGGGAEAGRIYYLENMSEWENLDPASCEPRLGTVVRRGGILGFSGQVDQNPHVGLRFKVPGAAVNPLTVRGDPNLHWVQPSAFFWWRCHEPGVEFPRGVLAYPFDCGEVAGSATPPTTTTTATAAGSVPTTTRAVVPPVTTVTTAPVTTTTVGALAVDCAFDDGTRRISCRATGGSDGSNRWTSSLGSGWSGGDRYDRELDWGEPSPAVTVRLERCEGGDCEVATATVDLSNRSLGDCPTDFEGWFTTFPLPDLSEVYEVGPPFRIIPDDYKGHGYFRVPSGGNAREVRMPADGILVEGSVYVGETAPEPQYLLVFRTRCEGLSFLFDHVGVPVPSIAALLDWEPTASSATTSIGPVAFSEGDLVGTSIGTVADGNSFLDFGVNDSFARWPTPKHPNAHGRFLTAVCMYDFFDEATAAYLRAYQHAGSTMEEGLCPRG